MSPSRSPISTPANIGPAALDDALLDEAMEYRRLYTGLIGITSKVPIKDASVLSLVYTPGVAEPCLAIARDSTESFQLTCRGNTVAIVTDGSGLFRLGKAGPEAALPVMEGKSVIFKTFAGIDALPICLRANSLYEFVDTVLELSPTFGGICLEDIAAPWSFTVTDHLQHASNIPVFNNHKEGVAVTVLAGLLNAVKVVDKELKDLRVIVNGAGMAGMATADLLVSAGAGNVIVCDRHGSIYRYRPFRMNWVKWQISQRTNLAEERGDLATMLKGADVLIGFSEGGVVTGEMVGRMARDPIIFALAVPEPEILPEAARAAGARVVATGRTDYPNQMDVALVFPGFFRGLLDVGARRVNETMLIAAARAIASVVSDRELNADHIVPRVLDYRVAPAVARAVAQAALETGQARVQADPAAIAAHMRRFVLEGQLSVPPRTTSSSDPIPQQALDLHRRYRGVLEIKSKIPIKDEHILSLFYLAPGAVAPAREIREHPEKVYDYTVKGNLVAIVTDGSRVLGLGDIGPRAALPVMEGKAVLFNTYAGVEAFPICLATQDQDEIVAIVKRLEPTFGGVNLEDITAPRCFYIERKLQEIMDIPVFHDDQHGTAIAILAGLTNACRLTGRDIHNLKVTFNGAGAAGVAAARLLLSLGVEDIIMVDRGGILCEGGFEGYHWAHQEMARLTNRGRVQGTLRDALKGRDCFIGLSVAKALPAEFIKEMAPDPIIFALANPIPEIMPDEAKAAGAAIVATGRSDLPNQVNNSLAFPGVFRGALDARVRQITDAMKIAAAYALADLVSPKELGPEHIMPLGTDYRVAPAVAAAVARTAVERGLNRVPVDPAAVAERVRSYVYEGMVIFGEPKE